MKSGRFPLLRLLLGMAVFGCALLCAFFLFTRVVSVRSDAEALSLAEQGIRRAAVECYALEGFYPADLSYLSERYGIVLDETRFIVHYQYVASNLMPDITVLPAS